MKYYIIVHVCNTFLKNILKAEKKKKKLHIKHNFSKIFIKLRSYNWKQIKAKIRAKNIFYGIILKFFAFFILPSANDEIFCLKIYKTHSLPSLLTNLFLKVYVCIFHIKLRKVIKIQAPKRSIVYPKPLN